MRLISFLKDGQSRIGVRKGDDIIDLSVAKPDLPTDLMALISLGSDALAVAGSAGDGAPAEAVVSEEDITYLPLIPRPGKVICIGRNYAAHAREGGAEPPVYPEIFYRGATSLVGHNTPIVQPACSDKLDYEAELVAIVGKTARNVSRDSALDYIAGYSIFNDATVRDYQRRTSQWTIGKNFDGTGAFGPDFVSADELPSGGHGLNIKTRLNGQVMQDANTRDFIFPMDDLVEKLSECMTLEPGDVIVTGTPQGVGYARTPPVFMQDGDMCEVEIEGVGTLKNPIEKAAA